MSTSLATQLRNLAVPSTAALTNDKKRPSLLFDPKEAAAISADVIYEIGSEGLEQLIIKNEIFEQFKNTLFHASSKSFDRNVQDKTANSILNKNIRHFLATLGPYVLTNSAHKALEWLYYRFTINEFNKHDLIMVVLPYYSSNIFTRIVQTLKFEEPNDPFYFLRTVKKFGVHLQRLDLFYQALSNGNVIKCFTRFMNQSMNVHKSPNVLTNLFNFYCTIFCGAIEFAPEITESFITNLLPLLLKGLDSPIPDYAAASYVITARLLSKTTVSTKLLDAIIEKASNLKCNGLKLETCLLIVLIYQLQKQYKNLPSEALDNLSGSDWLVSCLKYLHSEGSCIYPFLEILIPKAAQRGIQEDDGTSRTLLSEITSELVFDGHFIKPFLSMIAESIDPAPIQQEINDWLRDIFKHLETKYPLDLNLALTDLLRSKNISPASKAFIKNTFAKLNEPYASRFRILNELFDDQTEVTKVRLQAISKEMSQLPLGDQYLFSNILCEKMHDSQPEVVERTLSLLMKTKIGDVKLLQTGLLSLFESPKMLNDMWQKAYVLAADYLLGEEEFSWEMFLNIFPFILAYHKKCFQDVRQLFKKKFFVSSKLFPNSSDLVECSTPEDFLAQFFACLETNSYLLDDFLKSFSTTSCVKQYTAMLIVSHMCPNVSSMDSTSVKALFDIFKNDFKKDYASESGEEYFLEVALKHRMPWKGALICIQRIIRKTVDKTTDWAVMDVVRSDNQEFIKGICSLDNAIQSLLNYISTDKNMRICIALNVCSSGILDEITICTILSHVIRKNTKKPSSTTHTFTYLYSLILLTSPNEAIRQYILQLVEILLKPCPNSDEYPFWLLKALLIHKDDIQTDSEQLSLICANLLSTKNNGLNALKELFDIVCSELSPIYIKAGILNILSHVNNFEMFEKLCGHFLDRFQNKNEFNHHESVIISNLISRIDLGVIPKIQTSTNIWKFITLVLSSKTSIKLHGNNEYLPSLLMNRLPRDTYALLGEDVLEKLLDNICEVAVASDEPEVVAIANKIFKHLDLNSELVSNLLKEMVEVQSNQSNTQKKRRLHMAPTVDILDTMAWRKGICILEFIQGKKKVRNGHRILPVLFDILKKCLDFEEQTVVEYAKQLTLSLILLVCSRSEEANISEKDFNIELVIQCIRASQNPQTHYHALLALANAAKFVPNEVLHHVMAVFTFMGSTLIRHDDAYSFEIISKIVDTVIPILVSGNHVTTISDVLRVFVDALLDVPEHRRIPLYMKVLNNVDAKENFQLFLLLVVEAEVFLTDREKQKDKGRRINIAVELCQKFPPEITLNACARLAKFLNELPADKDELSHAPPKKYPINLNNFNAKQFRQFRYILVTFLSKLLSSQAFVNSVSLLSDKDNIKMEPHFKEMIINILAFIQKSQRISTEVDYWKIVLYHSYRLLDNVNDLLTPRMFLLVIKGLLMHSIPTVKKRALELLNHNLQFDFDRFKEEDQTELYILIQPVLGIVETIEQDNLQTDQETLIQTALLSLKLIVKILGPQDPEKFVQILDFIGSILNSGKAKDNVLASVILCLAELCIVLRGHGIVGLTTFMPAFLNILKSQKYQETSSMLLISVITTVNKLLESFAAFLSPYLKKLVYETSILISKWGGGSEDDTKNQALVGKLNGIKKKLGVFVPPRILIPIIEECYDSLIAKRYYKAVIALIDIMEEQLSMSKLSDVTPNMTELTNFFLKSLQFRCDNSSTLEVANSVEDQVVKTLTVFILKLSESTFRPFYLKLYDWAVRGKQNSERLITFYHLSEKIGSSLKGLFVLFAANILNNLSEVLRNINDLTEGNYLFDDQAKTVLLLEYALKTLHVIFTYDNKKLINRDRFELLMQPMIDLLEKDIDGVESLVRRNESLITPTIVQFSLAIADDSLWKELNYQILLKMRNAIPEIRLIALHCLTEVVTKLRDDFLPLLPETIPFLAELLEDEDERVEGACQKAIREMEKVLGEPLQKYF